MADRSVNGKGAAAAPDPAATAGAVTPVVVTGWMRQRPLRPKPGIRCSSLRSWLMVGSGLMARVRTDAFFNALDQTRTGFMEYLAAGPRIRGRQFGRPERGRVRRPALPLPRPIRNAVRNSSWPPSAVSQSSYPPGRSHTAGAVVIYRVQESFALLPIKKF